MRRDIDIALLRAFVAVSETGGMTSAGRVLNLTQAAISQQIKRLEESLGQLLFERDHKRLTLTPYGEQLIGHAQRLVAMNDQVLEQMTTPAFEGEVRLGVPHDIVAPYMPQILRSFSQARPDVGISLVSGTTPRLLRMLERGEVNLTLTTEPSPAKGEDMLCEQALVWVGAIGGGACRKRPLPVSIGDETCAFRATALAALRESGIDWRMTIQVSDTGPLLATLEADLAVGPMLASTVPPTLAVTRQSAGLPTLPAFYINLQLPAAGVSEITRTLAGHIRAQFALHYRLAA